MYRNVRKNKKRGKSMKHIYIINPAAGRGDSSDALIARIMKAYGAKGESDLPSFYITTGVGDATRYVHTYCNNHPGEQVRFYACGGDGTLSEVVNGAASHEGASVGLIPAGTGNDFVRSFTQSDRFMDFEAQRDGQEIDIDLIRCNGTYGINLFNTGFDCEVVVKTGEIKRKPLVSSGMAYGLGVALELIRKPGVKVELSVDGESPKKCELLLCAIGNGAYYGGGFMPLPHASISDGFLDMCIVDNVSRAKFVSLVGTYKKGEHVVPANADILTYRRCRSVTMRFPRPQNVCMDGEVKQMCECRIEVVPHALRFVVPRGSAPIILPEFEGELKKREKVLSKSR